jgi:hypothetical protein
MPSQYASNIKQPSPVKSPRKTASSPFRMPSNQHLLITTQKQVLSWDCNGIDSIFESGSEGILAARQAKDDQALLAIADSQVVILHNAAGRHERTYRLKGTDVGTSSQF